MHLLELFSGTGSVGRVFREAGWQVTSVDLDPKSDATIHADVRDTSLDERLPASVDLVWASPVCTQYSVARTTAKTPRDLFGADLLVAATRRIIAKYPEAFFFVENPWTGLLRGREVAAGLPPPKKVSYCKYATGSYPKYQKNTAIWTNADWWEPRPPCEAGRRCPWFDPETRKHPAQAQRRPNPGYPGWSLQQLYSIPPELPREILTAYERWRSWS